MSMHEDTLTIEAIKQGDTERYGELVERYQRVVYAIAWSRLGDADLCEDAAQETFVRGFRFLGALRQPEKFAAWIARIARNIASAIGRRHRRELVHLERWQLEQPTVAQPADSDLDAQESASPSEMLSDALAELSETHRECLVLFYLEDKSVAEGARLLQITEDAFKVRLHRARNALRGKMEERLERSLRRLGPEKNLRRTVLAAIPAAPIGFGAGGLALPEPLLSVVMSMGLYLVSKVPFFLYLGWLNWRLALNYREGGAFRKAMVQKNFLNLILFLVPALALAFVVQQRWGVRPLYIALAVLLLPALAQWAILLRVNRSRFVWAGLIGFSAMTVAFAGMGILGWPFEWFATALLVFNVALWKARESNPARQDYNLFLRAAENGLGQLDSHAPKSDSPTGQDLADFARFLGGMFLIMDYLLRPSRCIYYLPPVVGNDWVATLMPIRRLVSPSTLTIRLDGTCIASLAAKDLRHIEALKTGKLVHSQELENTVAAAVAAALARFQSGDRVGAAELLQRVPDESIFVRPPHQLASQKFMYVAGIVAAAVMLAGLLALRFLGHIPHL